MAVMAVVVPLALCLDKSSQFYDKQKKSTETVNLYVEALRKHFVKTYANLAKGGQEAESMDKSP